MSIQGCGLLETPYNFFIDHLAPLCAFLKMPLISSHPQTKLMYQNYYPNVEFRIKAWDLSYLFQNFSTIFYSFVPDPPFQKLVKLAKESQPNNPLWHKSVQFVYHLHGCSDKGFHSNWIEKNHHLKDLDLLIINGQRMLDILEFKGLSNEPKNILKLGNYRKTYYYEHQSFFDNLVDKEVFSKFKKDLPTLLYAPTWQDAEKSSSLFQWGDRLIQELTPQFNLIIKLHPNMTQKRAGYDPTPTLKWIQKHSRNPNCLFLPFYPLVYPILNRIESYIGDYSSVGYDALSLQKPLYFLNANNRELKDPGALLFGCGELITQNNISKLNQIIVDRLAQKFPHFSNTYYHLHESAFGPELSLQAIQDKLSKSLSLIY